MEKPDETAEKEAWGTWEELLLACAVNRYGTRSWDSVALQIKKRSSKATPFLTPRNCKQRFNDLKRRFTDQNDAVGDSKSENETTIPWVEELRKLRIAELKRELEHYDLSIVSLELKVNKLKEEGDESLENKLDLQKNEVMIVIETEPEKLSPSQKPVAEEPDRDNQSTIQSNSTDPKSQDVTEGGIKVENDPEPDGTGAVKPEPVSSSVKQVCDESCNGSSDSIEMVQVVTAKVEQEGGATEGPDLWETVAESKGSREKESSDVQSSASKLKKEKTDKVRCRIGRGNERENEDQSSPGLKQTSVKSQPLVDFLEILRSHKLRSVFERLLEKQETSKYRNLIRQHVDLKSVKRNVEEGWYLDCEHKFFRDLLLLINNVIVFFGKKSSESIAAIELRQLISKKMAQKIAKADYLSTEKQKTSLPLAKQAKKEPCDSLLPKPHMAGIITVCRKRSSIASKGSATSSGSSADRKREQTAALTEDKPILELKQTAKITKKRTRDASASSSKPKGKNFSYTNNDNEKNSTAISGQKNQGKVVVEAEKKNPEVKKQSAANFLDRMMRNSSLNNGGTLLLDTTLKCASMVSVEKNSEGGVLLSEQKRKVGEKKDKVSSSKRQPPKEEEEEEGGSKGKRKMGVRPSRKTVVAAAAAQLSPPPVLAAHGKRSRSIGDTDSEVSKQHRKKTRK